MSGNGEIVWSEWISGAGRVGLAITFANPGPGDTTATMQWDCWVRGVPGNVVSLVWRIQKPDGSWGDYKRTGYTIPGSGTDVVNVLVKSWGQAGYNLSYTYPGSSAAGQGSILAGTGEWLGGTSDISSVWYGPVRPPFAPNPPTALSATRVTDAAVQLTWTDNPVSPSAPYANLYLERWDNVTNGWYAIATLDGTWGAYADISTIKDRQYQYRIRAGNVSGYSTYATSGAITTTPAAPAVCVAARSGSDVIVNWTDTSTIETAYEILHGVNGVWDSAPLATFIAGSTTYTHVGAAGGVSTHTYKVRAISGSLYSDYSPTATLNTASAPAAPTGLAPSGTYVDALQAITFTWTHNPIDSTTQSAFQIRYRIVGNSTWTTLSKVSSGISSYTMPAATLSNNQNYEWQASTWGLSATQGAWSASATFPTAQAPSMTFTYPTVGASTLANSISPVWNYFSASSSPQAAWEVALFESTNLSVAVAQANGYETATRSTTFASLLLDGHSYQLKARVKDGNGQWSSYVTTTFSVDYLEPETPVLTLTWDPEPGWVTVQITNPEPTSSAIAPTSHNRVFRLNGSAWVLVADFVGANGAISDRTPPTGVTNTYKVIAVANSGGAASFQASIDCPSSGWLFVSSLANPLLYARGRYAPGRRRSFSRDKELHKFAGRTKPVSFTGPHRNYSATISLQLDNADPAGSPDAWMAVEDSGDDVCYRDPHGMRMFASLGELSFDDWSFSNADFTALSVPLTEVAHVE